MRLCLSESRFCDDHPPDERSWLKLFRVAACWPGSLDVVATRLTAPVVPVAALAEYLRYSRTHRAVNIKKYLTEGEGKAGIDANSVVPVKGKAKNKSGKSTSFRPAQA